MNFSGILLHIDIRISRLVPHNIIYIRISLMKFSSGTANKKDMPQ